LSELARPVSATRGDWLRVGLVAAVVIVLDQVSKGLLRGSLALGASTTLIPGVLTFVRTTNSGVAFSALSGNAAVVTVLAAVVLALLLAFFARFASQRLLWLPTGMVAGGALGNLIDRLRLGAVTDFIKLPDWPAFNLADSAITLGVIALVLMVTRGGARSAG
jgi:signal peptidase II